MDGIVPIIYIGLCLAVFMSSVFFIYSLWLLCKSKVNSDCTEVASRVLKTNALLVSAVLLITFIFKETIIGYSFLIYIVPIIFCIVLLVFVFQGRL